MFRSATIEISNICNARCRWCSTGVRNRKGEVTGPHFMSNDSFRCGIEYMLENDIIGTDTELELYNWGEPLLNPELDSILETIDQYGFSFHISTNASDISNFSGKHLANMSLFMISISGFSQDTYGRIHGFDFVKILHNIDQIARILKEQNKLNVLQVNMHMYNFNLHEYEPARVYFKSKGIPFVPRLAYFNDYWQFQDYLLSTGPDEQRSEMKEQIITSLIDEFAQKAPKDYICPQNRKIVLDDNWQVVPCCRLTANEQLGNLFELSREEIEKRKKACKYCPSCIESGQSYIVHRPMKFRMELY